MTKTLVYAVLFLIGNVAAFDEVVQLDLEVFKSMAKMPMPPVGNTFFTEFEFKTSSNSIVESLSYNATYVTHFPQEQQVTLMIPMDRVIMSGRYFSSLRIFAPHDTVLMQNNSGTYLLHMYNVNLRVKIGFEFNFPAMILTVPEDECVPTMQGMGIMLNEDSDEKSSLSTNTIRELLEFSTMGEFKKMFCDAMRLIAQSGQTSAIAKAIMKRIDTTLFN
uniref:Uncharacterized protein LOC100179772 n=1 Tax=Phallusia mammillata TaxID=59560 RepID=A0A6F9DHA6_9ASCI|nr:uncharacterized protein LOC100179772 [Phallusia mammillata]